VLVIAFLGGHRIGRFWPPPFTPLNLVAFLLREWRFIGGFILFGLAAQASSFTAQIRRYGVNEDWNALRTLGLSHRNVVVCRGCLQLMVRACRC